MAVVPQKVFDFLGTPCSEVILHACHHGKRFAKLNPLKINIPYLLFSYTVFLPDNNLKRKN